jgi:hypothetical protein
MIFFAIATFILLSFVTTLCVSTVRELYVVKQQLYNIDAKLSNIIRELDRPK